MEENHTTRNGSDLLVTNRRKIKPASTEILSISLPDEVVVIKGIDNNFTVNADNGTPSFSIPLPVSFVRGITK